MTDYIKREDALDIVADNNVTGEITLNRYDKIIDGIYEIPSEDVVPTSYLDGAMTLLKATYELLNKQNESLYVLNMLEETVEYYGAECDGSCLMEDIDGFFWEIDGKGLSDES